MRVPTFCVALHEDATTTKGPGCDEGTNLRLRDFAEVPLMPTRVPTLIFFNPTLKIKMVFGEKYLNWALFQFLVTIFFVKCYNKI